MNASRFALAGLVLGMIFLGLLPTTGPLSPARQGPVLGPEQLGGGTSASELPEGLNEPTVCAPEVGPAKEAPRYAGEAADRSDVTPAACLKRGAETLARPADGQRGDVPPSHLRVAESNLEQMLASWRASSAGRARRAQNALRQPALEDLTGLRSEAGLDELAKLVSYKHKEPDQPRPAAREEPIRRSLPGWITPASSDSAPLVGYERLQEAAGQAVQQSGPPQQP